MYISSSITVLNIDFKGAIKSLSLKNQQFDVIFMDPPYGKELEKNVLTILSDKTFNMKL